MENIAEKRDRIRQFGRMSAINSERLVEREDTILDRERNRVKLLVEWLVGLDYLVLIPSLPPPLKYFILYLEIRRISLNDSKGSFDAILCFSKSNSVS